MVEALKRFIKGLMKGLSLRPYNNHFSEGAERKIEKRILEEAHRGLIQALERALTGVIKALSCGGEQGTELAGPHEENETENAMVARTNEQTKNNKN